MAQIWNTSECLFGVVSTQHTATSYDVNVEKGESERNFKLFNHLLLREDGEEPQNPRWL